MSLFDTLNAQQKAIVEYNNGPQILIAGPGTGKSRVITHKLAYLIQQGIDPETILCVTFTNKAATDLKNKVRELLGKDDISFPWVGTFHSVLAKILRVEARAVGYSTSFSIYDTEDSESLVTNIINDFNINSEALNPRDVTRKISYLKNVLTFPEDLLKKEERTSVEDKFIRVYQEYQRKIRENDSMDLEDLIIKSMELLRDNKKAFNKYKKKFEHFIIDEFQETNMALYEIIKMLCSKSGKIFVTGDEAQSIYSWRGAKPENIEKFKEEFSRVKVFTLELSYRSTPILIKAGTEISAKNSNYVAKKTFTENEDGEPLSLIKCSDEKDEAYQLAKFIKDEIAEFKYSYCDFAVLYRTNNQCRAFEDVFVEEGLPFKIFGGLEYYKRREIKDLIAYLKVIINPKDEESLLRIMNFPQRGIGMTTIKRMITFSKKHEVTLFETMGRVFEVIDIKERIQKNVKNFKILLDKYIILKDKLSVGELTHALVAELELQRLFNEETTHESLDKIDSLNDFLVSISEFSKKNPESPIEEYLRIVNLMTDLDGIDESENVIKLMTVHSAKGMEFPVVFVSGLEEQLFPLSTKFSPEATIEEERRLFYVAVTRAKKKIFLSHARARYRFGEVAYENRSMFINEIVSALLKEEDASQNRKGRKTKKEKIIQKFQSIGYVDWEQQKALIKQGSRVFHEQFGLGKVISVVGNGDNQKVTVVFDGNNMKQLMLKFAKLKVQN
ncbi:MAG: UvrD-helicase domain-containing protein [Ignavibacteriaceae bacterium]|nr:UvrD-helicase domain-containing protein [Ignavibacteriaceae bacterium]